MYDNLPFETDHIPTIKAFASCDQMKFISDGYKYKNGIAIKRTCYYKIYNLNISIEYDSDSNPLKLTSRGSMHYYKNKGLHNADFVSLRDAIRNLKDFESMLKIDLQNLELKPFEIAQMIVIPFEIEEIVMNTFCEKRKMFQNNQPTKPSKISGSVQNDYRIKIYSKHHEHPSYCEPNTLRIELQAKRMRMFTKHEITTVKDLLEFKNWVILKKIHKDHMKHLVIFDHTIKLPKNSKFKKDLHNFSNENTWRKLIKECKNDTEYETKYNDEVKRLRILSKNYGSNIFEKINQMIDLQWFKFINSCCSTQFKITHFPKEAQLLKPKEAPFIACKPCNAYSVQAL